MVLVRAGGLACVLWLQVAGPPPAIAQRPLAPPQVRCFALELYVSGDEHEEVRRWAERAVQGRTGVRLRVFDVSRDEESAQRHASIARHFRLDRSAMPLLYGSAQYLAAPRDEQSVRRTIDGMLTMTVFVRSGCPRCARAREHLSRVQPRFPGLRIVYVDVVYERSAQARMQELVQRYRKAAVSVPIYHFCNQLHVGFDSDATSGRMLEAALEKWAPVCRPESEERRVSLDGEQSRRAGHSFDEAAARRAAAVSGEPSRIRFSAPAVLGLLLSAGAPASLASPPAWSAHPPRTLHPREPPLLTLNSQVGQEVHEGRPPPLPLPEPDPADAPLPLPGDPLPLPGDDLPLPDDDVAPLPYDGDDADADTLSGEGLTSMTLPGLGRIDVRALGMPLFTIAVGLVDGFNPCAMWVLLFLLSILVNLKDRWKIVAVAGTFVFISGLVYFAFMAAWLQTMYLFSYERPIQIAIGVLATVFGTIHIKDFFAFKKGVSLSIPESAKPQIYERVRRIVAAETLLPAVVGAATLAALVNLLELLCTAGLPATYITILRGQGRGLWEEYGFLLLYNLAYMFDDAVVLIIAVVTLNKYKLQERGGRWLKLSGGVVVLSLGLVMLFRPGWLEVLNVT